MESQSFVCRAELILYQLLTPRFLLLVSADVFKNCKIIDTADIGKLTFCGCVGVDTAEIAVGGG